MRARVCVCGFCTYGKTVLILIRIFSVVPSFLKSNSSKSTLMRNYRVACACACACECHCVRYS